MFAGMELQVMMLLVIVQLLVDAPSSPSKDGLLTVTSDGVLTEKLSDSNAGSASA